MRHEVGKREIDTSEDIQGVVDELEKRNWVRVIPSAPAGPGHPFSPDLQLHPTLDSHTSNASNAENRRDEGVAGINGVPIEDELGLRGRIKEEGADE